MLTTLQIPEEDWLQTPASVRTALLTLDRHVLRLDARCAVYVHQVERLKAEVAALKPLQAEVIELRERLGLNSRNSSQPPSSDPPRQRRKRKHEPSGRQAGGQTGHAGHYRPSQPEEKVDRVIDLRPQCCQQCGGLLLGPNPAPARHQVSEIPRLAPQVTEYRRHTLSCPACGFVNCAEWPQEMRKGSFGPHAQAIVAFLTGRLGLSQRDAVEVLQTVHGLKISLGSISAIQRQVSLALEQAVQAAQAYVQRQPVNCVDETTWPESGAQHWLWVNATEKATIFKLLAGRGQSEARLVIGSDYAGIATTDRFGAYNWLGHCRRQVCAGAGATPGQKDRQVINGYALAFIWLTIDASATVPTSVNHRLFFIETDASGKSKESVMYGAQAPKSNSRSGMDACVPSINPRSWLSISVSGARSLPARPRSPTPSTMLTHSNRDR